MAPELIEGLVLLAGVFAVAAGYRAWTAQIAHLNLSLFRPYRGDPWPIGVQEDDDFRFNWNRGGTTDAQDATEPVGAAEVSQIVSLDEAPRGLAVERVDAVSVRRRAN